MINQVGNTMDNLHVKVSCIFCFRDTESVMCDVKKISLKRKDERRSGKGNP